jgi:predicted metal-dependent peptidase
MSDKFFSKLSALQDPHGVARDARQLKDLQEKISKCVTLMFARPENGGDPFMFMLIQPKPHILIRKLGDQEIKTAATDGKVFYWNPEFLESLNPQQTGTVCKHEKRHVYLFHCHPSRGAGWDPEIRNIAFDFVDNGGLEADHIKSGRVNKFPLFGGPLGEPIRLKEMMDWIDGKIDFQEGVLRCYSDPLALERTADSIYYEMKSRMKKSPRRCKKEAGGCDALSIDPKTGKSKNGPGPYPAGTCQKCGAKPKPGGGTGGMPDTLDTHIQAEGGATKTEIMADLMKAASFAKQQRGTVPGEVEGLLKELKEPTLSAHDIIVNCFQRRCKDIGDNKDYTRFKRRPQYIWELDEKTGEYVRAHRLYQPKNYDHTPKWAAMIDTSASMSEDNMADGLKELKIVASIHESQGWIVPCDTKPHWDKKIEVTSTCDIRRTQLFGRGGTTFADFFRQLPKELGTDLDLVVVMTDGWIDAIPPELAPPCEVIWIITSDNVGFKPPFGRTCLLYPGVRGT